VEEPCSDINDKMIGFLDCRYYFPSYEAALEFFTNNSVEQQSACSLCSHGKTVSTYDKRLGYDAGPDGKYKASKCQCHWPCEAGEPYLHKRFFDPCPDME
jgi:hypothetical protein